MPSALLSPSLLSSSAKSSLPGPARCISGSLPYFTQPCLISNPSFPPRLLLCSQGWLISCVGSSSASRVLEIEPFNTVPDQYPPPFFSSLPDSFPSDSLPSSFWSLFGFCLSYIPEGVPLLECCDTISVGSGYSKLLPHLPAPKIPLNLLSRIEGVSGINL